jgi:hypothetical protein
MNRILNFTQGILNFDSTRRDRNRFDDRDEVIYHKILNIYHWVSKPMFLGLLFD